MENNEKRDLQNKMLWGQRILILTFLAFILALVTISIFSLFQTEYAFKNLNDDSTVPVLGSIMSWMFAFLFQYGQNVVLYFRKEFAKGKKIFDFFGFDVTDKSGLMGLFLLLAGVDAGSNCLWLYKTLEPNNDPVLKVLVPVIGYTAMIVIVFSEEVLGWTLDAFTKAVRQLNDLSKWEHREKERSQHPNQNILKSPYQNPPQRPPQQYQNGQRPNNNNQNQNRNNQGNNQQKNNNNQKNRRPEQVREQQYFDKFRQPEQGNEFDVSDGFYPYNHSDRR